MEAIRQQALEEEFARAGREMGRRHAEQATAAASALVEFVGALAERVPEVSQVALEDVIGVLPRLVQALEVAQRAERTARGQTADTGAAERLRELLSVVDEATGDVQPQTAEPDTG